MLLVMAGGGFFAATMLAIAVGVPSAVFQELERAFPARRMLVKPRGVDLSILRLESGISVDAIRQLEAVSGVARVYPVEPLRVPSSMRGDMLDLTLQTDVIIWGVPTDLPEFSAGTPDRFRAVNWRDGEPLAMVVPSFYLDLYNSGLAAASGLPSISSAAAVGRRATLMLGTSTMVDTPAGRARNLPGHVVGLTPSAQLLGVLLPIETVREINQWWMGPAYRELYVSAIVELESLDAYDRVSQAVEGQGLSISTQERETVATVRLLTMLGAGLAATIGLVVVVLGLLSLLGVFGMLLELRRDDACLFLAVGGTAGQLTRLYLAEVGVIAFVGALAGAVPAWLALVAGEYIVLDILPDLASLPPHILWLPWWQAPVVATCLAVVAMGLCAPMVRRLAGQSPASLMAQLE